MSAQGGKRRRTLLKVVLGVPLAILGIVVVYAIASLTDASLANVSVPVETAIAVGVLVVLALVRWLLTHRSAARQGRAEEGAAAALESVRAASWPPGRVTQPVAAAPPRPSAPILPSPAMVRSDPTVPVPATLRRASTVAAQASVRRPPVIVPATPLPVSMKEWGTTTSTVPRPARRVLPGAPPNFAATSGPAPTAPTGTPTPPRLQSAPVAPTVSAPPLASMSEESPTPVEPVPIVSPPPPMDGPATTATHALATREDPLTTRGDHGQERDTVTAAQTPGESNALAEYMSGRAELASLIANIESRMPTDAEPDPVVEAEPVVAPAARVEHETRVEREARAERALPAAPEPKPEATATVAPPVVPESPATPEPQAAPAAEAPRELHITPEPAPEPVVAPEPEPDVKPEPRVALVVEPEPEPGDAASPAAVGDPSVLLAQNTLVLTQAVEEVSRASELIVRACELFTERMESDRLERRTLADAIMTLAQQQSASPSTSSTPRLLGGSVFATPAWKHEDEIVIDDDRPDRSDRSDPQGSNPADRAGPGSTRTAPAVPRQSTWSGGS
jgi:hypothetical protein